MEQSYRIRLSKGQVAGREHLAYPEELGKDFTSVAYNEDYSEAVVVVDGTKEHHEAVRAGKNIERLSKKQRDTVVEEFHLRRGVVASDPARPGVAFEGMAESPLPGPGAGSLGEWQTPGLLLNGWENNGEGHASAGYIKDPTGFVHLHGLVRNGSTGADKTVFELSPDCVPAFRELHLVATAKGDKVVAGSLLITPEGDVVAHSGGTTWFSLDGVVFKAAF